MRILYLYIDYEVRSYQDEYYLLADGEVKFLAETDIDLVINDIVSDYQKGELTLLLIKQNSNSNENPFSSILGSLISKGVTIANSEQVDFQDIKGQILTQFDDSNGLVRIRKSIESNPHYFLRIICRSETATPKPDRTESPKPITTAKTEDLPKGTSMLYRIIARKHGVNE